MSKKEIRFSKDSRSKEQTINASNVRQSIPNGPVFLLEYSFVWNAQENIDPLDLMCLSSDHSDLIDGPRIRWKLWSEVVMLG